jgi:uncharacterized protein
MKKEKVDIWFDFSNPPHVNLFRPLLKYFENSGLKTYSTARNFVETTGLLNKYSIKYDTFGSHGGKNRFHKVKNLIKRNIQLYKNVPEFKISISSSFEAPEISWLKKRPSIVFDDNETAPNWLYAKFAKYVIAPSVIGIENWERNGINSKKVITYTGFKEDIYIAEYVPDENFLSNIPFKKFITIRPENLYASYVSKYAISIVPDLIRLLSDQGLNILYLPRYEIDKVYTPKQSNIFIPDNPLNGLDVSFYSDAVLTGAGTFAREAAILGTPAISFFAGSQLLTVDKCMIKKGLIFHSRKVNDIINFLRLNCGNKIKLDTGRSKSVQNEVFKILSDIFNKYI